MTDTPQGAQNPAYRPTVQHEGDPFSFLGHPLSVGKWIKRCSSGSVAKRCGFLWLQCKIFLLRSLTRAFIGDGYLKSCTAMVIKKRKPALSKSQFNAGGIHDQARTCLQCGSVIFYYNAEPHKFRSAWIPATSIEWHHCGRAMFATTEALALQRSVFTPGQPRDVACDSRAKGRYDWFCPVPGPFGSFRSRKEHDRTTAGRTKDNWLRVKATPE